MPKLFLLESIKYFHRLAWMGISEKTSIHLI